MATIRRGTMPVDFFTPVPHEYSRDSRLSWAARGLLVWLMSHAAGYKITEEGMISAGSTGRDGVRTMVRELEAAGYLCRERTPLATGGSSVEYVLTDPRATEKPSLANDGKAVARPDLGKQDVSAGEPNDGKAVARSSIEDQEKTKTPSVSTRAKRADAGTRLSEDFEPDEKMRAWYAAEKLEQSISGRIEHQKFMNYWLSKPGAAGRKTDWRRTWMNWMLTAAGSRPAAPGNALVPASGMPSQPSTHSTTNAKVMQGLALAEKFRQMEENQ